MAKLFGQKSCVVVTCGLSAIALDTSCQNKNTNLVLPEEVKPKENNEAVESSTNYQIVAADISISGKYIVVCTSNKQLILWESFNSFPLSTRFSSRIASKVKFTPSEKAVILADKSGDAYEFSVTSLDLEGKLLLGHLSMLLDVLVTPDERFVITCDRDEKIRVSCYPNAYNIQSYCLGHKEFVTSILFWNYKSGVEVHKIDSSMDLSPYVDIKVNKDEDNNLPIVLATCCNIDSVSSIVCCCVSNIQVCFVYLISGNLKSISHELTQTIKLDNEPWDILCFDKHLWVIGPSVNEFLHVFDWDINTCQFKNCVEENILSVVSSVNNKESLFKDVSPTCVLTLLYKRKFDNVQEYQNRKKQRLANSKSTYEDLD
ncbi:hypothetical protein L9F63_018262 [Diploptera punctata]|uniref:Uncharacterized protein n=1 Tax=Diploptera punctata TaxID=6984 RepID=A0AAD7ZX62_DIPPU|nr:hypothetical protein L9F63_018262 [Diploptera punctata]